MLFSDVYVQFRGILQPALECKCRDGENLEIFCLFEGRSTLTLIAGHNLTLGHNYTLKKLTLTCTASMKFLFTDLVSLTRSVSESAL